MLYTYSITTQNIGANENLNFNMDGTRTGCAITHTAGTPSIQLNRSGYYMVHFNASAAASSSGDITIQLNGNGAAIPGATSTANSTAATDVNSLNFTTIIHVLPNCCAVQSNSPLTLTFTNTGVEAIYLNAAVTITRLS